MKYLLIHSLYEPHQRGGAEIVVAAVVRGLVERGHHVTVITADRRSTVDVLNGVTIHRLAPANIFSFLDLGLRPMWQRLIWHVIDMFNDLQSWRIYRIIRQERPDVILTHNLKGLGYQVPLLIRSLGVRHIHTVHDMQLLHPSGLLSDGAGVATRIYQAVCRWLFGSPAVVIFPSVYLRDVYQQHGFFPQSDRRVLANPLPYEIPALPESSAHPFTVLYLGQVEAYKGIYRLIDTFRESGGTARLWVVGDGHDLASARARAAGDDRIIFWGRLSHEQMEEQIWPEVDVLVNPSLTPESFGLVVIEAYAHGVPVIAHRIGALAELVDQTTGWLVASDRPDELRRALERLQSGLCRFEAYRLLCQTKARDYSLEHYLQELEGLATIAKP